MRLAEGGSVQDHIKLMTEACSELSVIGESITEEDCVVYLLASLPECYNVLVTALESSADVPKLAVVMERLLHKETKIKSRSNQPSQEGALTTRFKKKVRCHFCNRPGHFKKDCEEFAKVKGQTKSVQTKKKTKTGVFKVTITAEDENSSDSESTGLVVLHALSADSNIHDQWILGSGATCHVSNHEAMFSNLRALRSPLNVTLGDGRNLQAVGCGNVVLMMNLPQGKMESCTLHDVLLVPDLAYNLLSVTAASKKGKVTTFSEMICEIRDSKSKLMASGDIEKEACTTLITEVLFTKPVQALKATVLRKPFGIVNLAT